MSALAPYPGPCRSYYCGRFHCDGCDVRPQIVAYYRDRDRMADYERSQALGRKLEEQHKRHMESLNTAD